MSKTRLQKNVSAKKCDELKRQQTSQIPEERQNSEVAAVFNNPMLLDNILQFVVYKTKKTTINRTDVATIRLVATKWLSSTSRLLKKSIYPVIEMVFDGCCHSTRVNGRERHEGSKELLNKFVSTFSSTYHIDDSLLTFKLDLNKEFFQKENFQCLKQCLKQCGNSLLLLDIAISRNGGSMPLKFGKLHLPILRKFTIAWERYSFPRVKGAAKCFGTNKNWLPFLQLVFNGALNLKHFEYFYVECCEATLKSMDSLQLPPSLVVFQSNDSNLNSDYRLLINKNLPNLQDLRLGPNLIVKEEQYFEILNRFRSTLKKFSIEREASFDDPCFLRFPLMEKLEVLNITSPSMQMDSEMRNSFTKCVPKLIKFSLVCHLEDGCLEWVKGLRFVSVVELEIKISNDEFPEYCDNRYKTPSLLNLEELQESFPNVDKLHLYLYFDDLKVIKKVFQDWTWLKELHLLFYGDLGQGSTLYSMASIFLGLPVEKVKEVDQMMKMSSKDDGHSVIGHDTNYQNSIINLKDLTTLMLVSDNMDKTEDGIFTRLVKLLRFAITKLPISTKAIFLKDIQNVDRHSLWKESVDL